MQIRTYLEKTCEFYIRNALDAHDFEFNMREKFQHIVTAREKEIFENTLARCVYRIRVRE